MPRKVSISGIYHIVVRGINKADVFIDDEDYLKLLYIIKDLQDKEPVKIFAYCIMTNHVHMLIQREDNLGELMKKILCRYVNWYNKKYDRTGHLFQNRFFSQPVETEAYFIAALQYIYNNPVAGGLAQQGLEYKWSNFCEWFWEVGNRPHICVKYEELPVRPLLLDSKFTAKSFELVENVSDLKIRKLSLELLNLKSWQAIQDIKEADLRRCVGYLLQKGARTRAIARVFGLSRRNIARIIKELEV